jgi:hypothetical protein
LPVCGKKQKQKGTRRKGGRDDRRREAKFTRSPFLPISRLRFSLPRLSLIPKISKSWSSGSHPKGC